MHFAPCCRPPLTIDREWLKRKLETDPEEGEIGAGFELMGDIPTTGYSDADALRDLQESILQSTTLADFMAVKKTVEAIREAEND